MRRGSIVALLGIGLIAGGVATAVALVPTWLPDDASREAGRIDFTFWFVIAICILIFSIVAAVMVYSVLQLPRARRTTSRTDRRSTATPGSRSPGRSIPFILVTAIAIVSAIVLSRNDAQAQDTLRDQRPRRSSSSSRSAIPTRERHEPGAAAAEGPLGRALHALARRDPLRSSCRSSSQKEDIVPGLVTQLHITPTRLGTFPLECTELCGLGHSLMRTQAIVVEPAAFDKWLKQQEKNAAPAPPTTTTTRGRARPRRPRSRPRRPASWSSTRTAARAATR